MTRIRTIKPEFWTDEKLAPLDPVTRLVFLGLISMADDTGRVIDNLKSIDAFIFPYTTDSAREALETLSRISRVRRGATTSGQRIIQIVHWTKHQRIDHPTLKACLPEIAGNSEVREIRETLANDSQVSREALALRPVPTTYDPRPEPVATTTTTPASPSAPQPPAKKKRRTKEIVIAEYAEDTRQVVNELLSAWPKVQPKDGSPIRVDVAMFASRIDALLRDGHDRDLLFSAAGMYLTQKMGFFSAPQFFFGPGRNGDKPKWIAYAQMVNHRAHQQPELKDSEVAVQ
jgi:hypothetical protein